MPDSLMAVCLVCLLLIPFAWAGLVMLQTGLSRARGATHAALAACCAALVAMLAYVLVGFSVQGAPGGAGHVWHIAGRAWDVFGSGPLLLHNFALDAMPASLTVLFLLFAVALAAIPATSAGAERWRLTPMAISTAIFAGLLVPLFSHWVWGGWLAQLGANLSLGAGVLDAAGSGCIQAMAGTFALSIAWTLGPRLNKFDPDGTPNATPGHDAPAVLLGCLLALPGWMGLNCAGAILFAGAHLAQLVVVVMNTVLCAAAGTLAVLVLTRVRFGRPDASLGANGCISGLAASSAVALYVHPATALLLGAIAGALALLSIGLVEGKLQIDDPAAAISVHGVGGIWGLLAAGFVAHPLSASSVAHGQMAAQLIAVAVLLCLMLPLSLGLNALLHRLLPQRVPPEGERHGIDLYELGSGAYPEFVTHHEDFMQR
jgi:Amt family ammonium transporter